MFKEASNPVENGLLATLPPNEYVRLLPKFEPVHFPKNRILYETGHTMRHAYFLNTGMVSVLAVGEDGRTIQIAAVGSEGFVGVPIILKGGKTPTRFLAQTSVEAAKIDAEQLLDEFNRSDKLRDALLRYSQVLQTQFVQSGICNPCHTVRQRLCRWLLVSSDCIHSDSLDLTQQHLADLLGKHLNQVGRVALELQQSGLIRYVHGRITILDRKGLETASCECYRVVRGWSKELLDF